MNSLVVWSLITYKHEAAGETWEGESGVGVCLTSAWMSYLGAALIASSRTRLGSRTSLYAE